MAEGSVADLQERIRSTRADLALLEAQLESQVASLESRQQHKQDSKQDIAKTSSSSNTHDAGVRSRRHPLEQQEYQRYGRQLILPEIGLTGQVKLRNASVLIVGVGGLGCPAAAYLAGAGVGTLGLIDGDSVDTSNLHRQILHSTDRVGMSKVESAVAYLKGLNPSVSYRKHVEHLFPETAISIFRQYDVVLDCTDHPTSRYLISDACVLTGKPLVSASALKTDGQLIVLNNPPLPPGEVLGGPCYRCIFPKPPPAESIVSCGEGGVLGPVVGTMGVLQALEAIKLMTKQAESTSSNTAPSAPRTKMLIFSAYGEQQFRTIRMRGRRPDCIACSKNASITEGSLTHRAIDYVAFCGTNKPIQVLSTSNRVDAADFAKLHEEDTIIVDTRDETQYGICSLDHSINIPWTGDSKLWLQRAVSDERVLGAKNIYIICRLGNDSQLAANALLKQTSTQFGKVFDIKGGFRAWRHQVDPHWPDY